MLLDRTKPRKYVFLQLQPPSQSHVLQAINSSVQTRHGLAMRNYSQVQVLVVLIANKTGRIYSSSYVFHAECKISRNPTQSAVSTMFCIILNRYEQLPVQLSKLLVYLEFFIWVYTRHPRIKFHEIVASAKTTKLITPQNFLHLLTDIMMHYSQHEISKVALQNCRNYDYDVETRDSNFCFISGQTNQGLQFEYPC